MVHSIPFKLRSDAKWSNGDPVTAGDYMPGKRHQSRKQVADYGGLFFVIEGASNAYNEAKERHCWGQIHTSS